MLIGIVLGFLAGLPLILLALKITQGGKGKSEELEDPELKSKIEGILKGIRIEV
jgi:hypothetical protein